MILIDVQFTWTKVKVKLLVFVQMSSARFFKLLYLKVAKLETVDAPREEMFPIAFLDILSRSNCWSLRNVVCLIRYIKLLLLDSY